MATKLGTLTLDLVARIGSFTQGMRQASGTAEREMRRVENSVVTVDSLIKKLAVTAGAAFSVSQIANYADSYISLQNRLKLVTSSQQELAQATNDTYKVAQTTAQSWDSTVQVYQRFAQNAKALGINLSQAAQLTETVSKAVAISGSTAESAEAALVQFGQALSSGVLRGDEFRSISEQAGGLRDAIAKGLKLSVGELREWAYAGKLTTSVVIKALQDAGVSVDELFNKTDFTGAQGWTLIQDAALKTVGEFSKATGATNALFESLKAVAENMDSIVDSVVVGSAFMAGTYIPAIYGATVAGYAKTKQIVEQTAIQYGAISAERAAAISSLAQAQAQLVNTQSTLAALAAEKALEVQRLQAQINTVGRMASTTRMAQLRQIEVQVTAELTAAETALAAARARSTAAAAANMGIGRAALGILGGPVGMGLTLAAVAAGYLLMKDGADKATASIDYQGQKLDDLIVKYQELNTLQRDNETKALADQVQDLSLKFRVASSDLTGFMQALPVSDEKINTWSKLHSQFSLGKISSDEYYKSIKALNFLSDDQLNKVRGLIGGYESSNTKMKQAEVAQKALAVAAGQTTAEVKKQAAETAKLTEELEKLLKTSSESIKSSAITSALASRGYNDTMIDLAKKYLSVEGAIVTNAKGQRVLRDDLKKMLKAEYDAIMASKNAVDSRNKSEEKTKKLIEAQGSAMKVNAKVAALSVKYNIATKENAAGLPANLIKAMIMQESRGNKDAIGPVTKSGERAGGLAQFMPKTAKQYNVNRFDEESSIKGMIAYMKDLLKKYDGNLDKAIMAYNAGPGNVDSGKANGFKETRDYLKKVKGYMGGASGASFNEEYSFDDWLKEQEQFAVEREKRDKEMAAKRKEVELGVASEVGRIRYKLADDIEELEKAGFSDSRTAELKAEYQKRADIDIQIAEAAHSDKLSGYSDYMKSEEQLLSESYARRQRDLKLDLTFTADEYKKASLLLEGERDKELQKARWRALEVRKAMDDQIKGLSSGADNIFAKATMSPSDYAKWSLENDRSSAQLNLKNQRVGVEQDIMTSDSFDTDDDRYQALLDAHKEYRDAMAALDVDYDQKTKELSQSQYENQLSLWGGLLGQAQNTWSQMTQAVKDSEGEQSGAFKAMFLMQQMFAIGSALVSTHLAAAQVAADATIPFFGAKVLASKAMLAMGYANVGLIAGQTIAGMAHDGIDNIPKEGTWLLDKGERVVDSRTNSDLKGMIAEGRAPKTPNINVYTLPGETADVSMNSDGSLDVRIRKIAGEYLNGQLSNPNSQTSKTMKQNFNVTQKR